MNNHRHFLFIEHCQLHDWTEWEWSNNEQTCGNGTSLQEIKSYSKYGGTTCDKMQRIKTREKPCPGMN